MRSFLAALRTLVLPYGRTSGPRIVLDGVNGEIDVYNATGLIGKIDSTGLLIQQDGAITVEAPNGTSISLLNGGVAQPELFFEGTAGTSGTIEFDSASQPGGFVFFVSNGKGALKASSAYWYFAGDTSGEGVAFDATLAVLKKLTGGALETWHNVALLNGWANRGATFDPLQYRLLPDGTVHLRGTIAGGTSASGTQIGTVPAGYRPPTHDTVVPIASDTLPAAYAAANGPPRLQVQSGGAMFIYGTGTGPLWIDNRWTTVP